MSKSFWLSAHNTPLRTAISHIPRDQKEAPQVTSIFRCIASPMTWSHSCTCNFTHTSRRIRRKHGVATISFNRVCCIRAVSLSKHVLHTGYRCLAFAFCTIALPCSLRDLRGGKDNVFLPGAKDRAVTTLPPQRQRVGDPPEDRLNAGATDKGEGARRRIKTITK